MTPVWIICERSTRWAAALRMSLMLDSRLNGNSMRIHEVRSLPELTECLTNQPTSVVLIEVSPNNLEATLAWLAATTGREKHVTAVALLDFDGADVMADALREAGAMEVLQSPRQIRPVVTLGELHARRCQASAYGCPRSEPSIESWAWSLLPWQDAKRPVG
jgi:hypothetical protein